MCRNRKLICIGYSIKLKESINSGKKHKSFPIDYSHYKTFAARRLVDVGNILLTSLAGATMSSSALLISHFALQYKQATVAVAALAGIGALGTIIQDEMNAQKLAETDDLNNSNQSNPRACS